MNLRDTCIRVGNNEQLKAAITFYARATKYGLEEDCQSCIVNNYLSFPLYVGLWSGRGYGDLRSPTKPVKKSISFSDKPSENEVIFPFEKMDLLAGLTDKVRFL